VEYVLVNAQIHRYLAYRLLVLLCQRYRFGLEFRRVYPPFFVLLSPLFLSLRLYLTLIFLSIRWGKVHLAKYNLKAVSAHVGLDRLRTALDEEITYAQTLGYRLIVCPWSD
jgi:hypothetical protein